jgi:hypothetical protein
MAQKMGFADDATSARTLSLPSTDRATPERSSRQSKAPDATAASEGLTESTIRIGLLFRGLDRILYPLDARCGLSLSEKSATFQNHAE